MKYRISANTARDINTFADTEEMEHARDNFFSKNKFARERT